MSNIIINVNNIIANDDIEYVKVLKTVAVLNNWIYLKSVFNIMHENIHITYSLLGHNDSEEVKSFEVIFEVGLSEVEVSIDNEDEIESVSRELAKHLLSLL